MVMSYLASQSGTPHSVCWCLLNVIYVLLHRVLYPCNVAPLLLGMCRGTERALYSDFFVSHRHRRLLSSEDMAASYSDNGKCHQATADNSASVKTSKDLAPATKMHVGMLRKCSSAR